MTKPWPMAAPIALVSCRVCQLLQHSPNTESSAGLPWYCARCNSVVNCRTPQSLTRTAALVAAAAILYIPANLLPILHAETIDSQEDDTIMGGILSLWLSGSWPLALLVFFVSIVVPAVKLISLSLLVLTTHWGSTWRLQERTVLFRFIELIGRWSMLDVFVVALLVGLVRLQGVATVRAEPGAIAFAAVVVLTMYAAQAFDPRLMWDRSRS